jgi:hypothetical protein
MVHHSGFPCGGMLVWLQATHPVFTVKKDLLSPSLRLELTLEMVAAPSRELSLDNGPSGDVWECSIKRYFFFPRGPVEYRSSQPLSPRDTTLLTFLGDKRFARSTVSALMNTSIWCQIEPNAKIMQPLYPRLEYGGMRVKNVGL